MRPDNLADKIYQARARSTVEIDCMVLAPAPGGYRSGDLPRAVRQPPLTAIAQIKIWSDVRPH